MARSPEHEHVRLTIEQRRARREQGERRRRIIRRRRILAFVALVGVAIVGVFGTKLILGLGGVSSGSGDSAVADAGVGSVETAQRDTSDWGAYRGPVPILMYHPIQDPIPGSAYADLFVSEKDFVDQVRWLDQNGFEAVTLQEVVAAWFDGGKLPPRPVVLSFDDGYRSQFANAFPKLYKRDWPGVLDMKARGSDLAIESARKMVQAGWEIASHTVSHLDLRTLDSQALRYELVESKRILERKLDTKVTNFCYPAGFYDPKVIQAVEDAGYDAALSTRPGLGRPSERWELARIRLETGDGAAELRQKMSDAGLQL